MRRLNAFIFATCLVLLQGCTIFSQDSVELSYELQPIPDEFEGRSWLHKLTFGEQSPILVQIEFAEDTMHLVGISPSGIPLAQLSWTHNRGIEHHQQPLPAIDWLTVIRDIQLVQWPLSSLKQGIAEQNLVQQTQRENGTIIREIYARMKLLVTVEYEDKDVVMINHEEQYQLSVHVLK